MYIQTARGRFGEKDVDCTSTIPSQHADVLQDIEEARVNGAFPEVSQGKRKRLVTCNPSRCPILNLLSTTTFFP
jgi:hypothetical protein